MCVCGGGFMCAQECTPGSQNIIYWELSLFFYTVGLGIEFSHFAGPKRRQKINIVGDLPLVPGDLII